MIHLDNFEHGQAIGDRIDAPFKPRFDRCVSRTRGGNLLGGVIYQDYRVRSVTVHVASWTADWLSRDLLWTIFTYPFDMLKVEQVLGIVASTNTRALDFDLRIGFKEVTRVPDVVPGGDLVVLSMRREDCRWLNWRPRYLKTGANDGQG